MAIDFLPKSFHSKDENKFATTLEIRDARTNFLNGSIYGFEMKLLFVTRSRLVYEPGLLQPIRHYWTHTHSN